MPAQRRKLQKTFPTLAAAVNWHRDAQAALASGARMAKRSVRLRDAAVAWLDGARAGAVRNRSGDAYKPSTICSYDHALDEYVLPALGNLRLDELARPDVQRFVDGLIAKRLSASTVRNAVMPLRAICRRAFVRGEITVNPTTGLELPASRGRRDRFATRAEARKLIAAAPERDRGIWATAFYAGLRRGALRALRIRDIDTRRGVISVERNWDRVEGALAPRSVAGVRRVPIPDLTSSGSAATPTILRSAGPPTPRSIRRRSAIELGARGRWLGLRPSRSTSAVTRTRA